MDLATLQPALDWIDQHRTWAGLAVFLISISESLVIVGLFVPGTIVMFGIGALVAAGTMDLWSTLAWAAAGAVVGDGFSYWIGRHYKDRLRTKWPLTRYPLLVTRGETFFLKHGGKSILFGRFVGPVRPMIPTIAGMMGMRPLHFTVVNVASALVWAPAYTLPGVVFGASMGLASQVASRLAVLVIGLVVLVWLTIWLTRRVYRIVLRHGPGWLSSATQWQGRAPGPFGEVAASVLDPGYPERRGLVIVAVTLLVIGWALLWVVGLAMEYGHLERHDLALLSFIQELRTPWMDGAMVWLSGFGAAPVTASVAVAILVWLVINRERQAVNHWIAAITFGLALALMLSRSGPALSEAALVTFVGELAMATVMYGFLAVLIARELPGPWRWTAYGAASVFVVSMSAARLYLGLHWPSQMAGGLVMGLVWVGILGLAYRRHALAPLPIRGLVALSLVTLGLASAIYQAGHYSVNLEKSTPHPQAQSLPLTQWWRADAWMAAPVYRVDLGGDLSQPLTLQWGGDLAVLEQHLRRQGWRRPTAVATTSVLQWLAPTPKSEALPVLPAVHNGHHDALVLVRPTADQRGLLALRLWPDGLSLKPTLSALPEVPLYVGLVVTLYPQATLPWLTVLRVDHDLDGPLREITADLRGLPMRAVIRTDTAPSGVIHWSGGALLAADPAVIRAVDTP